MDKNKLDADDLGFYLGLALMLAGAIVIPFAYFAQ